MERKAMKEEQSWILTKSLEQSWLKWKHFNHAFCGKNKTIEPFH